MINGLKPCPFCGGGASLNAKYTYRNKCWFVFVKCEICNGQGKTFRSNQCPADDDWSNDACDSAINAWNMRREED